MWQGSENNDTNWINSLGPVGCGVAGPLAEKLYFRLPKGKLFKRKLRIFWMLVNVWNEV